MFIVAACLGLIFGWLVEGALQRIRNVWAAHSEARYAWIFVLFIVMGAAFCWALYELHQGNLNGLARLLYFIAMPTQVGALLSFSFAAISYWMRSDIKEEYRRLIEVRAGKPTSASAGNNSGNTGSGPVSDEKTHLSSWLTGGIGAALAIAAAILALRIFSPELLKRVESFKVAGVEARFATTASTTARVQVQSEGYKSTFQYALNKWQGIEQLFDKRVAMVRLKFAEQELDVPAHMQALAKLKSEEENAVAKEAEDGAKRLLGALAEPLSYVMACYTRDHEISRDPNLQARSAKLALAWANFAILVQRQAESSARNLVLRKDRILEWSARLDGLIDELKNFIIKVDDELYRRESRCGLSSTRVAYGRDENNPTEPQPRNRRDQLYFDQKDLAGLTPNMGKSIPTVFANGYVLAYIADKLASSLGPEKGTEFLSTMSPYLDTSDAAITGSLNFHSSQASFYYYSEPWEFDEWLKHAEAARAIADRINKQFTGRQFSEGGCAASKNRLGRYYCALVARGNNEIIYGYVRDWMNGRQLNAKELMDLDELSSQLKKWLAEQSYKGLLSGADEEASEARVLLIANSYDTLGLHQLLVGLHQSDVTKDRCGLVWAYINRHESIWNVFWSDVPHSKKDAYRDAYKSAIRVNRAHQNFVESTCAK